MAVKYKLVKRVNPKDRNRSKWYATPKNRAGMDRRRMARAATENTSLAPFEFEGSLQLLTEFLLAQLQQGHTVNLPGLGCFRLTFRSNGAERIDDFNAATMIKNPRMVFLPAKEFRRRLKAALSFENGGVQADGINYASLKDYHNARHAETPDPTPTTDPADPTTET